MQEGINSGRVITKDGWIICPTCQKGKILKILPDSIVRNLPCKCKRCGRETIVNIDQRLSQCRPTTSA